MNTRWPWRNRWRLLRWGLFAIPLLALSWALQILLPPEPRWCRRVQFGGLGLDQRQFDDVEVLPGGSALAEWSRRFVHGEATQEPPLTLLDMRTGEPMRSHFAEAFSLKSRSFSRDGHYVACVSMGGVLRIADVQSGEEWNAAEGVWVDRDPIFSPDGNYLAWGGKNMGRLIRTRSSRPVLSWEVGPGSERFSAGGEHFFFHEVEPAKESGVRIWDLRRGALAGRLERSKFLDVTADGKTLFAAQKGRDSTRYDRVVIWDLPAAQPRGEIGTISNRSLRLAISPDARTAALWADGSGNDAKLEGEGGVVEFWDLPSSKRVARARMAAGFHDGVFSPDGTAFALMNSGNLVVLDPTTAREMWRAGDGRAWPAPGIWPLFTSDSRFVILQTLAVLQWLDATTGAVVESRFDNGQYGIPPNACWQRERLVAFETTGWAPPRQGWLEDQLRRWLPASWLPAEKPSYGVFVFDARSRRTLFELYDSPARYAMLSDDGETLVTIHGDDGGDQLLRCWDVPAHKPLRWVLGVPLAIGVLLVSLRAGWRWVRRPRAVTAPAPAPEGTGP